MIQIQKCYHLFDRVFPLVRPINQIITVCALLCNFQDPKSSNVDVTLVKWKSYIVRLQTAFFLKPQMMITYFCAQVKETIVLIKVYPKYLIFM